MSKEQKKNIDPQIRSLSIEPSSFNEADNTIEVVFATETPVYRNYWDGPMNEVLDCATGSVRLGRLNNGGPVVDTHGTYELKDQFGIVVRAWVDETTKQCRAILKLTRNEADKAIVEKIKEGIHKNVSVQYRKWKVEVDETGGIPVERVIDWEPMEISFVPMPADHNSQARSEKEGANEVIIINKNSNLNTMTEQQKNERKLQIQESCRTLSLSDDFANTLIGNEELSVEQARSAAQTEAKRLAELPKPAVQPTQAVDAKKIIAEERKRASEIKKSVRSVGLSDEFADELIEGELNLDQCRAAIINKAAEESEKNGTRGIHTGIIVNADETDKRRNAMTNGLALRTGQVQENAMKADEVSAAREFRGMTLVDMARTSLMNAGVNANEVMRMDAMEVAKRALSQSTSDFPVLLEGTNRRILLANYALAADTWRKFCAIGSVGDFREYSRLRTGGLGRLEKVNENGEYSTKPIGDATQEKVSVDTYGYIINLTRKMIVNDDLNGFARLAADLGRASARNIEQDVYALLASNPTMNDGIALFHASHGNLIATGTAMSVDSFEVLANTMSKQMDVNNNDYLDLRPSILLCGTGKGGNAKVINGSQYDPDASNKLQKVNKSYGLFNTIIDTPRITGTEYYAFCDAMNEPVIEVNFLNGVQAPYLESEEQFKTDGIAWKVRHDYGVDAIGWKGVVKNPGA